MGCVSTQRLMEGYYGLRIHSKTNGGLLWALYPLRLMEGYYGLRIHSKTNGGLLWALYPLKD